MPADAKKALQPPTDLAEIGRWLDVIHSGISRREAMAELNCSFNALKAFRELHAREHRWPDKRGAQL